MPPSHLRPQHALAYLRELQPAAREVALIGPGGVLLAGRDGPPARAARELQLVGGQRTLAGSLLAVAVGELVIAANLPAGAGVLAEFDLRGVASAVDVSFAG